MEGLAQTALKGTRTWTGQRMVLSPPVSLLLLATLVVWREVPACKKNFSLLAGDCDDEASKSVWPHFFGNSAHSLNARLARIAVDVRASSRGGHVMVEP